jgi:hypothetical protein
MDIQFNDLGGIIPQDPETAKEVNLITLPQFVEGKNCGNCMYRVGSDDRQFFCRHPRVRLWVNDRNACKLWNRPDTLKP